MVVTIAEPVATIGAFHGMKDIAMEEDLEVLTNHHLVVRFFLPTTTCLMLVSAGAVILLQETRVYRTISGAKINWVLILDIIH
jgi:S-adenosylmethionine:tRNA-ribosyltransferase-isomerase (queuine synthetase)